MNINYAHYLKEKDIMIVYFNGEFKEKEAVSVSPDDRGFLFADGLYEVVRSYQGRIFRIQDHLERLHHGASHLKFDRTRFPEFNGIARELLKQNHLLDEEAIVYFQVTRGAARRTHAFPAAPVDLTVYAAASAFDARSQRKNMETGIAAITVPDTRWTRCDMKTTGLTANVLANQQAVEARAKEAVFIRDGVLLEGTHSNFMVVFDHTVVTAPLSNYILGGVTRKAVLECCDRLNIKVEQRPVYATELCHATEMLVVGTTMEVMPIVTMNRETVSDGSPGPVTRALQQAFDKLTGTT